MNKISKFLMAGVMSLTVLAGCGSNGGGSVELQEGDTVKIGLNYVSCSPFRVPIARLAAAQAVIKDENAK